MNRPRFGHEKLHVYQAAKQFVVIVDKIVKTLPRGRAYVADQLQRAASSIAANIAEGAGEFAKKEKARFYRVALRSATECAAFLDVCEELAIAEVEMISNGRELLNSIVAMLTRMVINLAKALGEDVGEIPMRKLRR